MRVKPIIPFIQPIISQSIFKFGDRSICPFPPNHLPIQAIKPLVVLCAHKWGEKKLRVAE